MSGEDYRAQPCPCGSGRPFGDCCAPPADPSPNPQSHAFLQGVKQELTGQSFDSDEERHQALQQKLEAHNQQPQSDFQGLTPDQMFRLVYRLFEAPELVGFGAGVRECPPALIPRLFDVMAANAHDQPGIKLTDRGNLPRSVVNQAKATLTDEELAEECGVGVIRNEGDWEALHITRLIADMAGLTRKSKGQLLLTRKARSLWDQGDWAELFRILMQAYCRQFNWPYSDKYPELPFIQQAVGFSLYLLYRFGDQWRSPWMYADAFLEAFPDLPAEVGEEGSRYISPADHVRRAWEIRTLARFAYWFGLVEWQADAEGARGPMGMGQGWLVRRTAFADQAMEWALP